MGLGVPEIIVIVIWLGVGLVPFVIALWVVLTLRQVQRAQDSIERRLDVIERLLRER